MSFRANDLRFFAAPQSCHWKNCRNRKSICNRLTHNICDGVERHQGNGFEVRHSPPVYLIASGFDNGGGILVAGITASGDLPCCGAPLGQVVGDLAVHLFGDRIHEHAYGAGYRENARDQRQRQ